MDVAENWLHSQYKHKRLDKGLLTQYGDMGLSTEWFHLEAEDLNDIDRMSGDGLYKLVDSPFEAKEKPRITIYLTDEEFESVKAAAKRSRRTVRNYAEMALLMRAVAETVAENKQNETE